MTTVAGICRKHGFWKGGECEKCAENQDLGSEVHIITHDWIKQGVWEHIDPFQPNMRLDSKEDLKRECEARGLYCKAFMKPKSQGKGWEHARR